MQAQLIAAPQAVPQLSYSVEPWHMCKGDMAWLWPMHWEEVADKRIPLDVWFDAYDDLAATGQLHIITVRTEGGLVVGYHWSIIRPHLHYQHSLTAYTDIYFLHPQYRKGMNGVKLFKFAEQTLKDKGVERMYTASKVKLDMSAIFERLEWTKAEIVYTKLLGE